VDQKNEYSAGVGLNVLSTGPGIVVHSYNLSYFGSRDKRIVV
jgi:hypothetical protein